MHNHHAHLNFGRPGCVYFMKFGYFPEIQRVQQIKIVFKNHLIEDVGGYCFAKWYRNKMSMAIAC